ncbi:MAG: lytic transglycosylase domain-containing protein [Acidobacteriota bacterium]
MHIVLVALFIAHPSGSNTTPTIDPIDASELRMLEELSAWVAEGPQDIPGAIRQRPLSFEVFRSYHEPQLRDSVLADLPYAGMIRRTAERHGLDPLLVAAVVETESHFNPLAVSHRGAVGLMQVLPSTAALEPEALAEPSLNLEAGARYLRYLIDRYQGDLELALAAYNAGPANVRRYGGVPPFRETRQYVERVLARYFAHHQNVWLGSEPGELLASAHAEDFLNQPS